MPAEKDAAAAFDVRNVCIIYHDSIHEGGRAKYFECPP